jgi:hypothetical protein
MKNLPTHVPSKGFLRALFNPSALGMNTGNGNNRKLTAGRKDHRYRAGGWRGKENHERNRKIAKYERLNEELIRLENLPKSVQLQQAEKIQSFKNDIANLDEELFNE